MSGLKIKVSDSSTWKWFFNSELRSARNREWREKKTKSKVLQHLPLSRKGKSSKREQGGTENEEGGKIRQLCGPKSHENSVSGKSNQISSLLPNEWIN